MFRNHHYNKRMSKHTVMIQFLSSISIILATLILTACSHQSDQATYDHLYPSEPGGTLLDASIGEPSSLIFMVSGEQPSQMIASKIFNTLLTYNQDLDIKGELVSDWSISDDKKSITFHLHPNLKWADENPLTSADVLFTWQLVIDENTRSPYAADFQLVKKAEAPDPLTFIVTYEYPFAPALDSWTSLHILPKHLLEGKDIHTAAFGQNPLGSHYYQLSKWQHSEHITLTRNKNATLGQANIEKLITRFIPNRSTQLMELMADNIDLMSVNPTQYARVIPARTKLKKNLNLYKELGNGYVYLGFNLKRAPFHDIKVRQAINYAIDKQEIIDGVYLGLGINIASPYKPGTRWSNPALQPYPYDSNKARALLAEAGYTKTNQDGILVDAKGKPLSFEIITNNGNKEREYSAVIIQRRLKEVGIAVTIRTIEWASFIKQFINTGNFDAVILGWGLGLDPDQYNIWHSSQQSPGQFNFIGYQNPKVDQLLEQGRSELNPEKRMKIYHAFAKELLEDSPIVYLSAGYGLTAVHKRVQGIVDPVPAAGAGYDDHLWYIPQPYRRNQISAQ